MNKTSYCPECGIESGKLCPQCAEDAIEMARASCDCQEFGHCSCELQDIEFAPTAPTPKTIPQETFVCTSCGEEWEKDFCFDKGWDIDGDGDDFYFEVCGNCDIRAVYPSGLEIAAENKKDLIGTVAVGDEQGCNDCIFDNEEFPF